MIPHEHHHHEAETCCHDHHQGGCECHEHHHHHEEGGLRQKLLLIAATVVLLVVAVYIEHSFSLPKWQLLLIYLVPYLLIGHETLHEGAEGLAHGEALNEHFLMAVATIGALCIGFLPGAETQFPEAVFVMLFFQVGELFEGYAEGKSKDSIAHLMDIRPDVAHVERGGQVLSVSPEQVEVGETIVVRPGEKIPLDG
ncbi:MAG: heavy metal translocating P-type ATPase, partial [Bacteroidaceae bacterium]|nr:heavy metal translocating P-type ATPase [Bacteroidaceae bacterium]